MVKEGEGITGATGSSQDLVGIVSNISRYVKRELRRDGSKGSKHSPTMSRRRGY